MSKTLVIIFSETRAHELTFANFKKNVIDELQADLCVCIGVKPDYDYTNPFYQLAKHRFTYDEPEDFGDAFEHAYSILSKNRENYERLENVNGLYGLLETPDQPHPNVTHYGLYDTVQSCNNEDEIVVFKNEYHDSVWKNKVYGIKESTNNFVEEEHVITYKKPLYWREFLNIDGMFMGGVKHYHNQHIASAGILIFFRWFLLNKLIENDLINQYDRFIITRSDFMYQLPHPKVEYMDEKYIWFPDAEGYGGYTDRHVVLSRTNIEVYLNIFNNMVLRSNEYFINMCKIYKYLNTIEKNIECLIKLHLKLNNMDHLVKEMPYIMYAVRNINGTTSFMQGTYSEALGYFIKYQGEYKSSTAYKAQFEESGVTIDEFYKDILESK